MTVTFCPSQKKALGSTAFGALCTWLYTQFSVLGNDGVKKINTIPFFAALYMNCTIINDGSELSSFRLRRTHYCRALLIKLLPFPNYAWATYYCLTLSFFTLDAVAAPDFRSTMIWRSISFARTVKNRTSKGPLDSCMQVWIRSRAQAQHSQQCIRIRSAPSSMPQRVGRGQIVLLRRFVCKSLSLTDTATTPD